jgi:hypothetical protein
MPHVLMLPINIVSIMGPRTPMKIRGLYRHTEMFSSEIFYFSLQLQQETEQLEKISTTSSLNKQTLSQKPFAYRHMCYCCC